MISLSSFFRKKKNVFFIFLLILVFAFLVFEFVVLPAPLQAGVCKMFNNNGFLCSLYKACKPIGGSCSDVDYGDEFKNALYNTCIDGFYGCGPSGLSFLEREKIKKECARINGDYMDRPEATCWCISIKREGEELCLRDLIQKLESN